MKFIFALSFLMMLTISCSESESKSVPDYQEYLEPLANSIQRTGDAASGLQYLLYGDYIKNGMPIDIFNQTIGLLNPAKNVLERQGVNATIPYSYTANNSFNGREIVAPNCFQCHGGYINGDFVLGLGNSFGDFTVDQGLAEGIIENAILNQYGENSAEWEAYLPFSSAIKATSGLLTTASIGANPADKLALILAAHRDNQTLEWINEPTLEIPQETIPADVPAWWLLKHKSVMFSTAVGRGDYAKMMMASSILTLKDSTEARMIEQEFINVAAFIESLTSPKYPQDIDSNLALYGESLFLANCSVCHGTYGTTINYETQIVDHKILGTDSLLAKTNFGYRDFVDWFNSSWFSQGDFPANMVPSTGYVAPPLEGVWATAPYLHNGSIPDLYSLLKSEDRPVFWQRTQASRDYNFDRVGWNYEEVPLKIDFLTYDTTLPGYGNSGHTFGDKFNEADRLAVIEYLKTL